MAVFRPEIAQPVTIRQRWDTLLGFSDGAERRGVVEVESDALSFTRGTRRRGAVLVEV
jgi:hypothetical protein